MLYMSFVWWCFYPPQAVEIPSFDDRFNEAHETESCIVSEVTSSFGDIIKCFFWKTKLSHGKHVSVDEAACVCVSGENYIHFANISTSFLKSLISTHLKWKAHHIRLIKHLILICKWRHQSNFRTWTRTVNNMFSFCLLSGMSY